MTTALRRTAERRNKRIRWPISPTEKSAKLTPFRVIAPLDEKCTAYLAKKLTFATPGPMSIQHLRLVESIPGYFLGIEFLVYNVPYFIILSKLCSAYAMA